jgi:protein involved in polysaccharide export with SLBB domain
LRNGSSLTVTRSLCCAAAIILGACAENGQDRARPSAVALGSGRAIAVAGDSSASTVIDAEEIPDGTDSQRLDALWKNRTADSSTGFDLGVGDVLRISVPAIDQLTNRTVRVDENGTIDLPLAGQLDASGKSEQEVREELVRRLHKYMKHPQVAVFVNQYRSREVAVAGAVNKPGLYTLVSHSDTILDMVSRAGGMTENAAARLILIPSGAVQPARAFAAITAAANANEPAQDATPAESSTGLRLTFRRTDREGAIPVTHDPAAQSAAAPLLAAMRKTDSVIIDYTQRQAQSYLDLPARPGDVIVVPAAGEVMVQGWVQNPGAFKITPAMTVLGAITAAGGELYSSSVEVLRTGGHGEKLEIQVDLGKAKHGQGADPAVQSGDVVIVNRSMAGAVPYALYTILSHFNTGLYPALPF